MNPLGRFLRLCIASALLLAGCKASPWSASASSNLPTRPPLDPPAQTAAPATKTVSTAPPAAAPIAAKSAPSASSASTANAEAMLQVLAEVQKAGVLDEEARQRLLQDLKQTDPALWPLAAQQFRAALAYRVQAEQRRQTTATSATPAAAATPPSASPPPSSTCFIATNVLPSATAAESHAPPAASVQPVATTMQPSPSPAPATVQPAATFAVAAATTSPPASSGVTAIPVTAPEKPASRDVACLANMPGGEVQKTAYTTPAGDDWRASLLAAIRAREAEMHDPAKPVDDEARNVQLRMMYLLAGRRDDALRPIPGTPAVQNFWSEELYGLSLLMDSDHRAADASRRSAEARQHLNEATTKLGDACPLVVHNLNFCSEIQSYGCFKAFPKYEFTAGQNVLLYAEVENLGFQASPQGVHTSLRSSYQILDNRGQRVTEADFAITEEYCRNNRRDYFLGYNFCLPERIYPGTHTLQLTVEDLQGHKVGQSTIEFTIKK